VNVDEGCLFASRLPQRRLFSLDWRRNADREKELRAFVEFAFGPDAAAVAVDDAADDGQAYARAFEIVRTMKALEDGE
jgi:hypothetical protein